MDTLARDSAPDSLRKKSGQEGGQMNQILVFKGTEEHGNSFFMVDQKQFDGPEQYVTGQFIDYFSSGQLYSIFPNRVMDKVRLAGWKQMS